MSLAGGAEISDFERMENDSNKQFRFLKELTKHIFPNEDWKMFNVPLRDYRLFQLFSDA